MSEWFNWAVQNVKEHPEQLEAFKKQAKDKADALKEKVGGEIRDAIAEEKGPAEAQTWSQKLGLSSAPTPTTASGSKTAVQSSRQKYLRLAIKHWKYSIPFGMWFFSFVMSWLWWAFLIAGVVVYLKNRRKTKAA